MSSLGRAAGEHRGLWRPGGGRAAGGRQGSGQPPGAARVARARELISSRVGFSLLGVVLAGLLVFGSIHPSPLTKSERIAALETVIKCPACADASLAQSNSAVAAQLRGSVTAWVDSGRSNAWIEEEVVNRYGPSILLRPRNVWLYVLPGTAIAVPLVTLGIVLLRRRSRLRLAERRMAHRIGPPAGGEVGAVSPRPGDDVLVEAALSRGARR